MDTELVRRPRVARETRVLFTVAVLAVVALWALARLRFPESAPARQMVPPILAPFVARQGFSGLESQLAEVTTRTAPSLVAVAIAGSGRAGSGAAPRHAAALRLHDDLAVVLPGQGEALVLDAAAALAASDAVTGLAVLRLTPGPAAPIAQAWFRRDPMLSRYAMRTVASEAATALVPVVVGGLNPVDAPLWSGVLWVPEVHSQLVPGAFLFTSEGEWIGLVVTHHDRPAIAPAELVSRLAESRLAAAGEAPVRLGLDVTTLTPALGDLLGVDTGVVVTWVDPEGPAREALRVADVLRAAGGRPLSTLAHWRRHLADLGASPTVLTVWREGQSSDVAVTPAAVSGSTAPPVVLTAGPAATPPSPTRRALGLTARLVGGTGAEITAIQPSSPAESADLRVGDVITQFGTTAAPTPAQVRALAASAQGGRALLVAVTRNGSHHLLIVTP